MMRKQSFMSRITSRCFISLLVVIFSSCSRAYLLERLDSEDSGVYFTNEIIDSDDLSILDYLYFYNGGGVGAGDFNKDGLQDLFFISNQGQNKLYLNQGDLVFKDVTEASGIRTSSSWNTGVSIVDINNDGWLDIYVNAVVGINGFTGHSELWINQKNGTFLERSKDFGLDLRLYSVSTVFFDYDKDGDLDAYVVNHGLHPDRNLEYSKNKRDSQLFPTNDRLLRNDDGYFIDVTLESGLVYGNIGYGLAAVTSDFNQDGWDDIYVSNDFYENDYFYLNQGDGTFKESLSSFFTQTSQFSMGVDFADLNDDSYPEIFTLDMLPKDEVALKRSIDENTIQSIRRRRKLGYIDQFPRNHLQLNYRGKSFRDIANKAGIEASDWSWSALLSDLNNDGNKDLYVTNGILRRPNDGDFIKYISSDQVSTTLNNTKILDAEAIKIMPEGLVSDKVYTGLGDLNFIDVSRDWVYGGMPDSSNSGLLLVDLDNDGDLEVVLNGTNQGASIYVNNTSEKSMGNYLKIQLKGPHLNTTGIGTKVYVFAKEKLFYDQFISTRGFLSSQAHEIHIGVGESVIDSAFVVWPDNSKQYFSAVPNSKIIVDYKEDNYSSFDDIKRFEDYKIRDTLNYKIFSRDYPEFDRERLLPLGITSTNPVVAKSDLNNDGIDDFYLGGSKGFPGSLWLSTSDSWEKFDIKSFINDSKYEDADAIFVDLDRDGDLDLFVASGGGEYREGSVFLEDRIYLNDGFLNFSRDKRTDNWLRKNSSKIVAADFDMNGYVDLFVGVRSVPGDYTLNSKSYIYFNHGGLLNDIKDINFKAKLSKVTGADTFDFNEDGILDLVLALEWEGLVFLENIGDGSFKDVTNYMATNVDGVWQSLKIFDFDNDNDLDLLVGNLGLNTRFEGNSDYPLRMCYGDFNSDGTSETVISIYNSDDYYPIDSFDVLKSQLNELKKLYPTYSSFAGTSTAELLKSLGTDDVDCLAIEELRSGVFINEEGNFNFLPLPDAFQHGPGTVINLLDDNQGFVFGGIKTDVAAIHGAMRSQPFIVYLDSLQSSIIPPKLFTNNSNLVPLKTNSNKEVFLALNLGAEVFIIESN